MDYQGENIILDNEKGQGTVEYILLLIVLASLTNFIIKSSVMKDFLGNGNGMYEQMARIIEFSYRYGHNENIDNYSNDYNDIELQSYRNENGNSRFFGPTSTYDQ